VDQEEDLELLVRLAARIRESTRAASRAIAASAGERVVAEIAVTAQLE
jgi:hypothetical protein